MCDSGVRLHCVHNSLMVSFRNATLKRIVSGDEYFFESPKNHISSLFCMMVFTIFGCLFSREKIQNKVSACFYERTYKEFSQ